jgi:hypothetical protein
LPLIRPPGLVKDPLYALTPPPNALVRELTVNPFVFVSFVVVLNLRIVEAEDLKLKI